MFVGWIREGFAQQVKAWENSGVDTQMLLRSQAHEPGLCYGAYDEDSNLKGVIAATTMQRYVLIHTFVFADDDTDTSGRLLQLLLTNLLPLTKPVLFMAQGEEKAIFEAQGFALYAAFDKRFYKGKAIAFNFTPAHEKSINNENYRQILQNLDRSIFGSHRNEFLQEVFERNTSLYLSTDLGYQHSCAIGGLIRLGPWVMYQDSFMDAERLLRGLLHYRGLKKIVAFSPKGVGEIEELYDKYAFQKQQSCELLYLGDKPKIVLEGVYAF